MKHALSSFFSFMYSVYRYGIRFLFPPDEMQTMFIRSSTRDLELLLQKSDSPDKDICTLFSYKNPIARSLVWYAKFHHDSAARHHMTELMKEALSIFIEEEHITEPIDIVPIPSHPDDQKEKGFSLMHDIAQALAEQEPEFFRYAPLLEKIRKTPHQRHLSRTQRLTNLVGSFNARPSNNPCIIIDDVMTTGATLKEARRALEEKGVPVLSIIVFAH